MKLAQYVHYLNNFHLLKTECQLKGSRGRIQKTIKKYQEFIKILTLRLGILSLSLVIL